MKQRYSGRLLQMAIGFARRAIIGSVAVQQ